MLFASIPVVFLIAAGYPGDGGGSVQMDSPPVVTEAPMSHTVNPEVVTVFTATATGAPVPSVQWQVSLDGSPWMDVAGATERQFSFVANTPDDGKRFRAVFTNAINSVTTAAALLNVNPVFRPARRSDFDGDGRTDVAIWRPSPGTFFALTSKSGNTFRFSRAWGVAGDKPFTGDLDGDGIVDLIVWRPSDGTWYWLTSTTGYDPTQGGSLQWGLASEGDIPILADFDGDGLQDFAVYRNSTGEWYWLTSTTNYTRSAFRTLQWGVPSLHDIPLVGDFDGDGKQDLIVARGSTGEWFWLTSSTNYNRASFHTAQWGVPLQNDIPFTGDFDGDGKSELIVYRPSIGTWFWLTSSTGYSASTAGQVQWGTNSLGDEPAIGDFNGDGRADIAIWRAANGNWLWLTSSSGFNRSIAGSLFLGTQTDLPIVAADYRAKFAPIGSPPVVTEAPMSRTVNREVVTVFTATATGSPLPSLQWQVSLDGTTWTNIPGATESPLSFVVHSTDNGKRFRAVFTNSVDAATTPVALLNVNAVVRPASRLDFDGDGRTDVALWRPSTGTFFALTSKSGYTFRFSRALGGAGDQPLTGDIDGDGIVDLIVWRPTDGTWYWVTSTTGYDPTRAGSVQWGIASEGDFPILADFDGDGRQDFAVYRNSTGEWFWLTSSTNYARSAFRTMQWGVPGLGDMPLVADFDGDGKQDLTVWRRSTGEWFWLTSSTNYARSESRTVQWGMPSQNDMPLTGDVDGDGKSELIVYRSSVGTWFWLTSSSGYFNSADTVGQVQWGVESHGHEPMIGDFDGDGRADIANWNSSGQWSWLTSSSGFNHSTAGSLFFRGASTDITIVR